MTNDSQPMDPQLKPMDPQLKSILTTVAAMVATSIASWAAKSSLIPTGDQSVVANALVTVAFGAIAAGIGWYKTRSHTPDAQIAAINDPPNGLKVVKNDAANAAVPMVTAPLK